jgi:hypothetical protein
MDTTNREKVAQQIEDFKKDYPNVELSGIIPGENGDYKLFFKPKLATLSPYELGGRSIPKELREKYNMSASTIYRDSLFRSDLDLVKPDVVNEAPHKLYSKVRGYYRSMDVFGTFVDTMVNLAISGFENDCEDLKIKEFYDNWCQDVDIHQVLEWVFQELYTTGFVRTYKVLGKYEPQINRMRPVTNPPAPAGQPKRAKGIEEAERKIRWSKGFVPLAYTILNPTEIEIRGSIFLNQTRVVLRPNEEMEELVKREDLKSPMTDSEKKILDNVPPEIKSAIKTGKEIELDPELVGEIDYRRMPFEKYPIPPFARALEVVEYKQALREADYSTLDGITSELLIVTVGDKDNPVLDDEDLRQVAQLFNTSQKAYAVVWNHTLKVERLAVQNIDSIFGAKKFEQAEVDMSGSIGLPRALLDGVVIGNSSKDALDLAVKAVVAELTYARRQVARWIYKEYKQIADAFGFDRYPHVRWDSLTLKDELAQKTLIQGFVDRRIISYHTAHKLLGFDPEFEKKQLTKEKQDVIDGNFGILGSPYQKGGGGGESNQPIQKTPSGTPSEGRPKGDPSPKTPAPSSPDGRTKEVVKKVTKEVKEEIHRGNLQVMKNMSLQELHELELMVEFVKSKKNQELANLIPETVEDNIGEVLDNDKEI